MYLFIILIWYVFTKPRILFMPDVFNTTQLHYMSGYYTHQIKRARWLKIATVAVFRSMKILKRAPNKQNLWKTFRIVDRNHGTKRRKVIKRRRKFDEENNLFDNTTVSTLQVKFVLNFANNATLYALGVYMTFIIIWN